MPLRLSRQRLIDVITGLPSEQQLVLTLCYEHGLNFGEAASVLQVDATLVRAYHDQAMLQLDGIYRGPWDGITSPDH